MALERNPNERSPLHPDDAIRMSGDIPRDPAARDPAAYDSELQADPELAEGPASASRIAMFAVAIAVVLGAVFYGLNNSGNSPTGTNSAQTTPPAATQSTADSKTNPPNIRNVTPNRESGMTTGSAPAQPQAPQSRPTGTEVDQNKGSAPSAPAPTTR